MTISTHYNATEVRKPEIKKPFLWKSPGGCIFLRPVKGSDVIISPREWRHQTIGEATINPTRDEIAWAYRLPPHESVTLKNED